MSSISGDLSGMHRHHRDGEHLREGEDTGAQVVHRVQVVIEGSVDP